MTAVTDFPANDIPRPRATNDGNCYDSHPIGARFRNTQRAEEEACSGCREPEEGTDCRCNLCATKDFHDDKPDIGDYEMGEPELGAVAVAAG